MAVAGRKCRKARWSPEGFIVLWKESKVYQQSLQKVHCAVVAVYNNHILIWRLYLAGKWVYDCRYRSSESRVKTFSALYCWSMCYAVSRGFHPWFHFFCIQRFYLFDEIAVMIVFPLMITILQAVARRTEFSIQHRAYIRHALIKQVVEEVMFCKKHICKWSRKRSSKS